MTTPGKESGLSAPQPLTLRERKKIRTRQSIIEEAFRLFAAHGIKGTTIERIAAACEIAPSTFSLYFRSKDDVLFADHFERAHHLVDYMSQEHDEATSTIDLLSSYLREEVPWWHETLARRMIRRKLIDADPRLAGEELRRYTEAVRPVLVESFARDLGVETWDLGPRFLASLATTVVISVARAADVVTPSENASHDEWYESAIAAGMAALRAAFVELQNGRTAPAVGANADQP